MPGSLTLTMLIDANQSQTIEVPRQGVPYMVRQSVSIAAMAMVAAGLGTSLLGQASKAQGTVAVGATTVTITSVAAVGYKAPNGQLISVLLSDKPADAKAFATDTRI